MKNLILLTVFTAFTFLNVNAQNIEIPTEILTPAMVNQNNSMVKSNSLLAQARRAYIAGKNLPAGITLFTATEDYVGSFTKNHSRQMISDGAWIAKTGTPFFYQVSTQSLHYVFCLNRVRTFQKLSSLVEPKIVYEKGETIFLPEPAKQEARYYADSQRNVSSYDEPEQEQDYSQEQQQITCNDVVNAWDRVQAMYTRRMITRRGAKQQFGQLQMQYPDCLAGYRPVWRKDVLKALVVAGAAVGGYYLGRNSKHRHTTLGTPVFIPGDGNSRFIPGNSSVSSGMQQYYAVLRGN